MFEFTAALINNKLYLFALIFFVFVIGYIIGSFVNYILSHFASKKSLKTMKEEINNMNKKMELKEKDDKIEYVTWLKFNEELRRLEKNLKDTYQRESDNIKALIDSLKEMILLARKEN